MGILLERWPGIQRAVTARRVELTLIVAAIAYFTLSRTLLNIPMCPFAYLGINCPTCGTTRAVWQIFHGHFWAAWSLNPIGFIVVFLLLRRLSVLSAPRHLVVRIVSNQVADIALLGAFFCAGFMKFLHVV
jgi:hypothetical protein